MWTRRDASSPSNERAPIPAATRSLCKRADGRECADAHSAPLLADRFEGKPLGRLNDLVVDAKGERLLHRRRCVLRWLEWNREESSDDIRTNGVMLSRDEKTVYVTNGNVIVAFDILPDGSNRPTGATSPRSKPAATVTAWRSTPRDVSMSHPRRACRSSAFEGKYLGLIPTPRSAISVAFSGPASERSISSAAARAELMDRSSRRQMA